MLLAAGLVVCGAAAQALTPEELWADWQAQAAAFEVPVTAGAVERDGATLTLRDVRFGQAVALLTVSQMVLRQGAGGAVLLSDLGQVRFDGGRGANQVRMQLRPSDLVVEFSDGAWTARATDLALAVFGEDMGALADDVGVVPPLRNTRGEVVLQDVAASGRQRLVEGVDLAVQLLVDEISYDLTNRDPVTGVEEHQSGGQTGFALDLAYAAPAGFDGFAGDLQDAAAAGLVMSLDMASTASRTFDTTTMTGFSVDVASQGGAGTVFASVGPEGMRLAMTQAASSVTLASRALFGGDLSFGLGMLGLEVVVPLIGTAPQKTALRLTIEDLATTAAAWDRVDPQRLLPRLPAALTLDIAGMASPADVQALMDGELGATAGQNHLTLNTLALSAAGATLTGSGRMALAEGAAGFEGAAEMRLEGSGQLIESLIALGVIPPEAVSGVRMGLAMGFDPEGETGDVLVSRIEAGADGSLRVNGARMR